MSASRKNIETIIEQIRREIDVIILPHLSPRETYRLYPNSKRRDYSSCPPSTKKHTFGPPLSADTLNEGITLDMPCDFSNEDIMQLFSFLKEDNYITTLLMSGGGVLTNETAFFMAEVLKTNTSLRVLDLHYNHIPAAGISAIIEALGSNKNLQLLNIRSNFISDEILERLLTVLKTENMSLRQIELTQNNFREEKALDTTKLEAIYQQLYLNLQRRIAQGTRSRFSRLATPIGSFFSNRNHERIPERIPEDIQQEIKEKMSL